MQQTKFYKNPTINYKTREVKRKEKKNIYRKKKKKVKPKVIDVRKEYNQAILFAIATCNVDS